MSENENINQGDLKLPFGLAVPAILASREERVELLRRTIAWGAPFALIVYLAMRGGGYDAAIRTEVGIVAWAVVAIGAAAGAVPRFGSDRTTWTMVGLLGAFVAWTALGVAWTESDERTVLEVARVLTYLGVFVHLLSIPGPGRARLMLGGVGAAIAVIGVVGILSRLHPEWFGPNVIAASQPLARARLAYPLDAWNGLASFSAIGFPLLLVLTVEARRAAAQAAAAAALPVLGLATYLTYSRGGALATGAGLVTLLLLYRRRWDAFVIGAVALAGALVLIVVTHHYQALADGLDNDAAHSQGDRVLVLTVIMAAVVAAARWLIGARWAGAVPRPRVSRALVIGALAACVLAAGVVAIAADVPGRASDAWQDFKDPTVAGEGGSARLTSFSGNGRYQLWDAAVDAGRSEPLHGIGAGTYEFWWARNASIPGYVRDAHSLLFETFAELGLIGLLLLGGFVIGVPAVGANRARRAGPSRAGPIAAAAGGAVAFNVALAFDWGWEIAVIPIVLMALATIILSPAADDAASGPPVPMRVVTGLVALAVLFVLVTSYVGTTAVTRSQEDYLSGDTNEALEESLTAQDYQPYAATPLLQEALLLEKTGDLFAARDLTLEATEKEPTNWRIWLTLSRFQVALGETRHAVASYERALALNPRSNLVPQGDPRLTHPDRFP